MAVVTAQMSLSLDGFYAGPKHLDMETWMEGPEAAAWPTVGRCRGATIRRSTRPSSS
jgi:hypothetical protein